MNENKITDYKIVSVKEISAARESIRHYMKIGYRPYGNPFVYLDNFTQAMAKFDEYNVMDGVI